MTGRIVDISGQGRHLSLKRGFLCISHKREELGRIPLDDIDALIANGYGLTYSNNLVLALAKRGAAFVLCGPNHLPQAFLWPVDGHHAQNARMRVQIAAPKPLNKRLWRGLVRAKIGMQGAVIGAVGGPAGAFDLLARKVKSGDPENIEAQAARRYWPLIFGKSFRRDKDGGGINGLLNYGYAILRSAAARSVMAAGLHPTIGIHHANRSNAMCLVDDIMEPFRPIVDLTVKRLLGAGTEAVTPDAKAVLARITAFDMQGKAGISPLSTCMERLALSIAKSYETGDAVLDLPHVPMPLDLMQGVGSPGD